MYTFLNSTGGKHVLLQKGSAKKEILCPRRRIPIKISGSMALHRAQWFDYLPTYMCVNWSTGPENSRKDETGE